MTAFILVHGAGHGAWCWEQVVPLLEADGHEVRALDMPGRAGDERPHAQLTLSDYVDVVEHAAEQVSGDVVIAGHSLGGMTVTQAADRLADRIKTLVYITAWMPRDGETTLDLLKVMPNDLAKISRQFTPDKASYRLKAETAPEYFYNACPAPVAEAAIARLVPEPAIVSRQPVHVDHNRLESLKRVYVECRLDRAIPPQLQQYMHARWPGTEVVPLECDHSPFFSNPRALADILIGV